MGVYNDFQHVNRFEWRFRYTGAELLVAAKMKYREFVSKERTQRETMSQFMMDMTISQSDHRIADCKKEIEKAGTERERCMVWIHEFARKPDQEYLLELGDVTYFDLAPEPRV